MAKLLRSLFIASLWLVPATALADNHEVWPCTLLPAVCSAPPPVDTSAPWLEANAANAVTAIVLLGLFVISTRRSRWEATQADRVERKRSWSQPPSYSDI